LSPGFLSRGHGGSFGEPHIVDLHHDAARHVGDEPLLLAEHAPVAVTPNRAAGARLLMEKLGCDFLIMDDGFQSARLHIDFALVVVDTRYGIGNGRVIPGGPLRANIVDQLVFTSALLKMGEGTAADPVVR
ncbi:MAG: tetraacyldisaccharide 4'-kinase, partial [Mesorhizobium sp.]